MSEQQAEYKTGMTVSDLLKFYHRIRWAETRKTFDNPTACAGDPEMIAIISVWNLAIETAAKNHWTLDWDIHTVPREVVEHDSILNLKITE